MTILWDQVLSVRPAFDEGRPATSHEGTNDAGSFVSACDSEKTDHSEDNEQIIYNPATTGLSPAARLRERFAVKVAKDGECVEYFGSMY